MNFSIKHTLICCVVFAGLGSGAEPTGPVMQLFPSTVIEDIRETVIEMDREDSFATSHHPHTATDKRMVCPKCGVEQSQGVACSACGIIIDKHNQRLHESQFSQYTEPAAVYDDAEDSGTSTMAVLSKLVVICILCAGGYFGYSAVFATSRDVVVYRIDICAACDEAIDYLEGEGIACTVYDVDESDERRDEFFKKSDRSGVLPLLFVGDMRIDGNNGVKLQVAAARYNGTLTDNGSAEVVMYCRDSCGYCKSAVRFFNEENIAFIEYDIDTQAHNAEYQRLQGVGTPLIFIGDIRLDGFSKDALGFVLDEAGLM